MAQQPEMKVRIEADPQDIEKLNQQAQQWFEKVRGYQEQIEEKGYLSVGDEKSYRDAMKNMKSLHRERSRLGKLAEKEQSDARKEYLGEARKIVEENERKAKEKTPRDILQKRISGLAEEMYQTAAGGQLFQEQRSLISALTTGQAGMARTMMRGQLQQYQVQGGGMLGQMQGPMAQLAGRGMGMPIGGLMRGAGLGALAYGAGNLLLGGIEAYENFQSRLGPVQQALQRTDFGLRDQIMLGRMGSYMTSQESMQAIMSGYQGGAITSAQATGLAPLTGMMSRVGWGDIGQVGQFMGRMQYMGNLKDRGAMTQFAQQMTAYRTQTGNVSPSQLMPMMNQYASMVSGATGTAVDTSNMMGMMQAMAETNLPQGMGELGMQTMQRLQAGTQQGMGRALLMREYAAQGLSYSQILDKMEKGIGDPDNLKTMRGIAQRSSKGILDEGARKEREDVIYRSYFNLRRGDIDMMRTMNFDRMAKPAAGGLYGKYQGWQLTDAAKLQQAEQLRELTELLIGKEPAEEKITRMPKLRKFFLKLAGGEAPEAMPEGMRKDFFQPLNDSMGQVAAANERYIQSVNAMTARNEERARRAREEMGITEKQRKQGNVYRR